MLIHCLVDYDGRTYGLRGAFSSDKIAKYHELGKHSYLTYGYDLSLRKMGLAPDVVEAPFCPKPLHEEAAKNFFDAEVGTPEKLATYVENIIFEENLILLLTPFARNQCREAFKPAETKFAEKRIAAELMLASIARPAHLNCLQKCFERELKYQEDLMDALKLANEAAAQNEAWQTNAVSQAREEFCRQLSEAYNVHVDFMTHCNSPFFSDFLDDYEAKTDEIDKQYCDRLRQINKEYKEKRRALTRNYHQEENEIIDSWKDDRDKLIDEADRITEFAQIAYENNVVSAFCAFNSARKNTWLELFKEPKNRILVWRS